MIFDRGAVDAGVDCGYLGDGDDAAFPGTIFQENIGSQPFMKVNRRGVRFCNESTPYDFLCFQAGQQPGGVWCEVFDANAPEDILRFDTMGCSGFAKQMMAAGMPLEEFVAASKDAGILKKADTLEELADQLGFEGEAKEAFLEQVERYNAQFDAQADDDFGKRGLPPFRSSHCAVLRFVVWRNVAHHARWLEDRRRVPCSRREKRADSRLLCRRRCVGQFLLGQLPRIHCRRGIGSLFGSRSPCCAQACG